MPPRYTEMYFVFVGPDGGLWVSYEDDWEVIEEPIDSLVDAFTIARQRSPDWVITDSRATASGQQREYRPKQHLAMVPQENPFYLSIKPEGQEIQRLGPMSEADFWIEDLAGEGLRALFTSADPTFSELGDLLRDRRMDLGLTQKQVAQVSGVSPQGMSDLENGRGSLPFYTHVARKLDAYFEGPMPQRRADKVSLEEAFSRDPEPYKISFTSGEDISYALKKRREDLGLTQQQVADAADVNKETVSKMERGERKSTNVTLRAIARALRVELPHNIKQNPAMSEELSAADIEHYEYFHGVPPDEHIDFDSIWVPGGMALVGKGKDVGYGILNNRSNKDGWYVHDFGKAVKVYKRPRSGQSASKTWSSFPSQLTSLGYNLGFTYIDDDGTLKEVKGSKRKYLAVTPNRRTLVVVGPKGVEYLMEGGNMRVDDWIRD